MSVSDDYLGWVLDQLGELGPVASRRMFGAAGLYLDGVMFGLVDDDVVFLRAGDANRADYVASGCEPFRPIPGKASMSYYEVPPAVLEDPTELAEWARRSLAAAEEKAKSKAVAKAARKARGDPATGRRR